MTIDLNEINSYIDPSTVELISVSQHRQENQTEHSQIKADISFTTYSSEDRYETFINRSYFKLKTETNVNLNSETISAKYLVEQDLKIRLTDENQVEQLASLDQTAIDQFIQNYIDNNSQILSFASLSKISTIANQFISDSGQFQIPMIDLTKE